MADFWALTPRETAEVLEARAWMAEQEQTRMLATAWWTVALGRTKRLPELKRLLTPPKARALRGEELQRRQAEHERLKEQLERFRAGRRPNPDQGDAGQTG